MKSQPNKNYKSNDEVMTPKELARDIIHHFKPVGTMTEPCKGSGNFLEYMPGADWCEVSEGKDFFDYNKKVDWIITNPPWSQIRKFLKHSMELSNDVIFLMTINHLWTKARIRDIKEAGFGIKEIMLVDTPKEFPPMGFQLGAIHLQKYWDGDIKLSSHKN